MTSKVYNVLKWLAVITMTIDHVGLYLYPDMMWLRWVGRLSFPLFLLLSVTSIRRIRFYPKKRTRTLILLAVVSALTYWLLPGEGNVLPLFFWLLLTARSWTWLQLAGLAFSPWVDYGWVGFLFAFLLLHWIDMPDRDDPRWFMHRTTGGFYQWLLFGLLYGLLYAGIFGHWSQWITFFVTGIAMILAIGLVLGLRRLDDRLELPRFPPIRGVWVYLYYPLHRLVLLFVV